MTVVSLPFYYEASYARKRDKDMRRTWVIDSHPFMIADVSGAATTAVMRAPVGDVDLLWVEHDGDLYRPLVRNGALLSSLDVGIPEKWNSGLRFGAWTLSWPDDPSALDLRFQFDLLTRFGMMASRRDEIEAQSRDELPFREWGFKNRDARLIDATWRYSALAMIDGIAHIKSPPPCYRLTVSPPSSKVSVDLISPPLGETFSDEEICVHFGLHEREAIERTLELLRDDPTAINGQTLEVPDLMIPDVHLFTADLPEQANPDRWTLTDVASRAAQSVRDKSVWALPPQTLVAFANLFNTCRKGAFIEEEIDLCKNALSVLAEDRSARSRETMAARLMMIQEAARTNSPVVMDDMAALAGRHF